MSASKHKKKHRNKRKTEKSILAVKTEKTQLKKRKRFIGYVIVATCAVIATAAGVFFITGIYLRILPAVRIGGIGYPVRDFNYLYRSTYLSFYDENESNISAYLDIEKPLSEQICTLEISLTWAQYFQNEALSQLQYITAMCDAASDEGFALSAEDIEEIDYNISTIAITAESFGYSLNDYLALIYGDGNNQKTIRTIMEKSMMADRYSTTQRANFSFSEEELYRYYSENSMNYNTVSYLYAIVTVADSAKTGITAEIAMEDAFNKAQIIAAADSEEIFRRSVLELTGNEATSATTTLQNLNKTYFDWLTDPKRMEGDTNYWEQSNSYYVFFFNGSTDNNYNTISVRHIMIAVEDSDSDGAYGEDEIDTAYRKLMSIRDMWIESGGSEERFAELAREYSEDGNSSDGGGLYEGIYKGQMTDSFDKFCFETHEYGDSAIIYVQNWNYTGYHLIYYVGEGEPSWRILADNAMRDEAYAEWTGQLLSQYKASKTFMYRYIMEM